MMSSRENEIPFFDPALDGLGASMMVKNMEAAFIALKTEVKGTDTADI